MRIPVLWKTAIKAADTAVKGRGRPTTVCFPKGTAPGTCLKIQYDKKYGSNEKHFSKFMHGEKE